MLIAVVDKLIVILFLFLTLSTLLVSSGSENSEETILEDFIICRQCGTDVSLSNFLINKPATSTLDSNNITLFNKTSVLVQQLENPAGVRFQIVTVNVAFCAKIYTQWRDSYSWFPGYAWKLCLCPKCSTHLGWMFEPLETATDTQILPTQKGFYGLIVSRILPNITIRKTTHRKSDRHIDTTRPDQFRCAIMVDPNRKINHLTEDDVKYLNECENEFKDRFTENDDEFMALFNKPPSDPPVGTPWMIRSGGGNAGPSNYRGHHRSGNYNNQRPYHHRSNRGRGGGGNYNRNYHHNDNNDGNNRRGTKRPYNYNSGHDHQLDSYHNDRKRDFN